MKRGVLLVVSGPSGAGKGTICKALGNLLISFSHNKSTKKR